MAETHIEFSYPESELLFGKASLYYCGAVLWNQLNFTDLLTFRTIYKQIFLYVLSNSFVFLCSCFFVLYLLSCYVCIVVVN